jgi:hypothetical protein
MFLNGIQDCCAFGSSCNVHPNTAPVEESFHRCMNCALKFHLCITCSECCFGDWFLGAAGGGGSKLMLLQYGQEKFDHYNDDLSLSPLELCSYCKSSLSLSMDALCSSAAATTLAKASHSSATTITLAKKASLEVSDLQHVSNDASGNRANPPNYPFCSRECQRGACCKCGYTQHAQLPRKYHGVFAAS